VDISAFSKKETTQVTLKNPRTGEETDAVITMHGVFSKKFRPAYLDFQRRNPSGTLSEIDSNALADLTDGWVGMDKGGKPFKFTHAHAIAVYESSAVIRSQLIAAIVDGDRFLESA